NSEPFFAFLDRGNYDIPPNRNGRQISNLSMPEIIQKLDLQDRGDRPLSTKERDPEEQRGHDRLLCAAKGVVRRCSPGSINCLVRGIEGQVYLVLVLVEITCLNPCRDLM
ncbi:hypothetical protein, partial [Agrobacterium tumefaciens]|uniref:hypothetical protein n=1 Tax=Agrobacterium tumefaciens TaxID=358 RepID=UPI001CBDF120